MSKKILMIVLSTYPNDTRVKREVEALNKIEIKVDIICLRNKNQKEYEGIGESTRVFRIMNSVKEESILDYLNYSFKFLLKSLYFSAKLLKKEKYNLVQVHNLPDYLVFSAILFKLNKIPIILDLHDLTPELFISKWNKKHRILSRLTKIIEKFSCNFANKIITTSEGFKEALIARGISEDKISVIINYPADFITRIKPPRFGNNGKELKLVYHGTIAHRFGLHLVIESIPIIKEKIPNTIFHIYGSGDPGYKDYLTSIINEKGLLGNVQIFDSLILEEIVKVIQDYDIGLVPYLEDRFMQLAISTKSFEYAKLFIPIVASDLKPIRYFFDDNDVIYFKPNNHIDLANKVILLTQNKNLMEKIANNAFKKVEFISNGSIEKKYQELILGQIKV